METKLCLITLIIAPFPTKCSILWHLRALDLINNNIYKCITPGDIAVKLWQPSAKLAFNFNCKFKFKLQNDSFLQKISCFSILGMAMAMV